MTTGRTGRSMCTARCFGTSRRTTWKSPNIGRVTNGALRGLLESLDADSSYLTPAEYKIYKTEKPGRAQVGINVSKRFQYATVVSVVPGSPADKANLADGDIIEAIGSQDTRELSLAIIQMLLDGQPGSSLTLSVVRPRKADPDKITLTRTLVAEPPVGETMYENSSILYLKPAILDHEHVQQVEAKLKAMNKNGNKKVLLDLRDVAAGDMPEAVRLANFFLKSGTIATLEGQKFPQADVYRRSLEDDRPGCPCGRVGQPRYRRSGGADRRRPAGQQAGGAGRRAQLW